MNITILTTIPENGSRKRLTKKFSTNRAGEIVKQDYDRAYLYDADTIAVTSIDELHAVLTWLETEPATCVIRGDTIDATRNIRRALVNDPARGPATIRANPAGVSWIMLDFDKLPIASLYLTTEQSRLDYLVSLLPPEFHGASYHFQWSSSAGLDGWQTASAHLWYYLDAPWLCRDLYERFATGDFRHCEVDPAPFTPNQPHYTANPIFDGVNDPVACRSGLNRRDDDTVTLSTWFRPVEPPQTVSNRDHYASFGLSRFEDLLADVGPHFHRPLLRAAAHYFAVVPSADQDRAFLIERLVDAIHNAPPGRSRKRDYLDRHYLDRVVDGASRKYGRAF